ncbi:CxxxxCH/CxxCH domain-containing protein [Epidermidibacterium keratini]|uniref:CxxxxCH/CxxCH domain-containing protein n=1 Tax=Epidermidibacterium keratini TaxID=1891644 RepID=A0A7L4YU59_9ACTN|nr:CxxxxCH/CxxCH domain-containing protein [Epidermidibacterium keratini]
MYQTPSSVYCHSANTNQSIGIGADGTPPWTEPVHSPHPGLTKGPRDSCEADRSRPRI